MLRKSKRILATVLAVGAFSAAAASPASAAPVTTGGFVNITVVDAVDLQNVNVQVPIGVAANVCGVSVAVIGAAGSGPFDCTSATTQDLPVRFRP